MTRELSLNDVLKFMNERGFNPAFDKENDQVYIEIEIRNRKVPIFFGIISEGLILQMISYLPFVLHQSNLGEVGRLLHYINKEIDIPGFGMDEKTGVIFFRTTLPCLDKKWDEKLVELYMASSRLISETFINAIEMVAAGATKVETVMKEKMQ